MSCPSCFLNCIGRFSKKGPISDPSDEISDDPMSPTRRRALHYVLKVGNRKNAYKFFTSVLSMRVLRHEEFETGCEAMCNGPYHGKWSKTMVGYGPEDSHFVFELVYNYGIGGYNKDNELISIEIMKDNITPLLEAGGMMAPMVRDGIPGLQACVIDFEEYRFKVFEDEGENRIGRIVLASADSHKSLTFWMDTLEMKRVNESLQYGNHQCKVQFKSYKLTPLDEAEAYGRIAFSCPRVQLEGIQERVRKCKSGGKVQVPLVKLPTPGKADVEVVVLKDPDGHEICFVGDEAFLQLAVVDPDAERILLECIEKDKSEEWFKQKGQSKMVITRLKRSSDSDAQEKPGENSNVGKVENVEQKKTSVQKN
ncbi:unnamed protein product [Orchesella dallaii]|uniref:VOC domain-containing protein n=1 Tax=Orchesella dallaii TaxID=48710 RepID=A0ABP1QEB3_9HEXA